MRYQKLTTEQMERLLEKLGYALKSEWEAHRLFENKEFEALFYLRPASHSFYAEEGRLLTLRRNAIDFGMIEPEDFDALVEEITHSDAEMLAQAS